MPKYYDIAGMEIVGADEEDDLFGANPNFPAQAGTKQNPQGLRVRETAPSKWRLIPLAIDSGATLIVTTAQATLTIRPQAVFRPYRLVVSQNIMADFTVDDVRVGVVSQFVNAGSLPADMFGPTAAQVELKGDTCNAGFDITLLVTNQSGASRRFRAGLIGYALLP